MSIWQFMDNHWFLAFVLIIAATEAITAPFKYFFKSYNRYLRAKNIAARGWPTAPLMDADGDIVHPKKD